MLFPGQMLVNKEYKTKYVLSEYFTPQNLSEITGIFEIILSILLSHPMAVPCHVGPDCIIFSSDGLNISDDVVRKLYPLNSFENVALAS